ncbi:glycyl-tRNA synthetase beta chain [Alkalibacterium subtropicum]|uniref:Glycine--tRNA ligase beta subunit n=1 Tax=Alkalibacterium subtropicum TaxID=753702 RepID=A0A1I1JWS1_9LACT|nr:glycine--tRNA ligase subunit beta [Alkalibacterium subtropicum]SFC52825.1 glycyl-tRNA synthetase beta chain [Alkalibacterium subtropicum]
MTHTFLLEIGLEEMPAKVVSASASQLKSMVSTHLKENGLKHGTVDVYSTPRRLAVRVEELEEKQADRTETVKGPAKRIALDDEGNWSKAAIGFSKGQKASVEDIVFKEVKGEAYVFIEKEIKGQSAKAVLETLADRLPSMTFPVSMKWGNHSYKFIRPVHWLVALLDEAVVDMELFDVASGRETRGHRFLGHSVTLDHARDYEEALNQEAVIVDRDARRKMIVTQIQEMCQANSWQDPTANAALVDEVTDLVEFPTVFSGSFDEAYLKVPEIVLETAMADHQRYFPVREAGEGGSFLPYFIAVRNGNDQGLGFVRKGNEKVLSARLADAAFFYEEDNKHAIDYFVEKLKQVSFHEKIGSLYEKQERIERIADSLVPYFTLKPEQEGDVKRAARICKFDLVTQTVTEFTSLQGQIAGIFARERQESDTVAQALAEQYLPDSMEGGLPESKVGAILSLADKMDSLMSFFAIGLIPTGSNDPFALRRQAMGIVRMVEAFDLPLSISEWIDAIIHHVQNIETKALYEQNKENVSQFILDRLDLWLSKYAGLEKDYDVREAVLNASHDNLVALIDQARVLKAEKQTEQFKPVVESLTRVANLAEKADPNVSVDAEKFESDSERELYDAVTAIQMLNEKEISAEETWKQFVQLHPLIDAFFDENMVMADDEAVKANRLALLDRIHKLARPFAQFSTLVIK